MVTKLILVFFIIYLTQIYVNGIGEDVDSLKERQSRLHRIKRSQGRTGSSSSEPSNNILDSKKAKGKINYEQSYEPNTNLVGRASSSKQYSHPNDPHALDKSDVENVNLSLQLYGDKPNEVQEDDSVYEPNTNMAAGASSSQQYFHPCDPTDAFDAENMDPFLNLYGNEPKEDQGGHDSTKALPGIDLKNHSFIATENRGRCHDCVNYRPKYVRSMCGECGKQMCDECFKLKHNLDYVPIVSKRTRPDTVQKCEFCNENIGFGSNESAILNHLRTCDKIPTRETYLYRCYVKDCTFKGSNRSDAMKQHIRAHTEYKPHKCSVCNNVFRYRSSFNKHKRTKHGAQQ